MYNHEIAILIHIPLLDLNGKLDVFKVTAKYDIDTTAIMVNTERTKFAVLSSEELQECSKPLQKFCEIKSPMYQVSLSQRCSIALYLKNDEKINSFCHTIVSLSPKLPIAEYLYKGHWVVTTSSPIRFVVLCYHTDQQKSQVVIQPPIGFIKLEMNCRAYNEYLILTAWFSKASSKTIRDSNDLSLFPNLTQTILWKPLHKSLGNETLLKLPPKLQNIKQIPMAQLIDQLTYLRSLNITDTPSAWPFWYYILIAIGVLIVLTVVAIFIKFKYLKKKASVTKTKQAKNIKALPLLYQPVRMSEIDNQINHKTATSPDIKETNENSSVINRLYPSLNMDNIE